MAELARIVALRGGFRTVAQRISKRLDAIFNTAEIFPEQKVHELENKITDITTRPVTIEDYDQQILALTAQDNLQQEVEDVDTQNLPFRNQIDLHRYQLNVLRRMHDLGDQNQVTRQNRSCRSTSRLKVAPPRITGIFFNGSPSGRHSAQK